MQRSSPRVSLGLPVYNGGRYLERQLRSLLGQDFGDFELVISDNASTDETERVCREYAARDPRVRYHRSPTNRGLAWNWNRAFALSRAPYFKWVAHDDEHDATFLSRCVAVLDADPTVVLCHSASVDVDEEGLLLREWPARTRPAAPEPHVRFTDLLDLDYPCFQVFGVVRSDVLRQTSLHGPYPESDRVLLAELALRGRLVEVPEPLFRRREHAARSVRAFPTPRSRQSLYTGRPPARFAFPTWRMGLEMSRAVARAPLPPAERLRCAAAMRHWLRRHRRGLAGNVAHNALSLAGRR